VTLLTNYETLLLEADRENLKVKELPLSTYDGRIIKNKILIRKDISTTTEKVCVLAEELGHYYTTVGNILDQDKPQNHKQELQARFVAYNKLIGLHGIVQAYKHGCRNRNEVAEYLEVTEQFLNDAIDCYKTKYGLCEQVDNYIVYFEPCLLVIEMF
jgi:hypothetical protein